MIYIEIPKPGESIGDKIAVPLDDLKAMKDDIHAHLGEMGGIEFGSIDDDEDEFESPDEVDNHVRIYIDWANLTLEKSRDGYKINVYRHWDGGLHHEITNDFDEFWDKVIRYVSIRKKDLVGS